MGKEAKPDEEVVAKFDDYDDESDSDDTEREQKKARPSAVPKNFGLST